MTQSSITSLEEYIEETRPIFESKRMTNMGSAYKKLQTQLKRYLDLPELSLLVNIYPLLEFCVYHLLSNISIRLVVW